MTKQKTTYPKKLGRKPSKDAAIYRYGIKLNSVENTQFEALFRASGMKCKTHFIKAILFNRTIKVITSDKSLQNYYKQLTHIYGQYLKVGCNYDQVVKTLKTNFNERRALILLNKLEKATMELVLLNKKIIELTMEVEKRCLEQNLD